MKIITTSDGSISFKEEGYITHEVGCQGGSFLQENELRLIHKDFPNEKRSYCFVFANRNRAMSASKEIIEQLKSEC